MMFRLIRLRALLSARIKLEFWFGALTRRASFQRPITGSHLAYMLHPPSRRPLLLLLPVKS